MGIAVPLRRASGCAVSLVYHRPGEEHGAHRHTTAQLTLLLAGGYREESEAGVREVFGPAMGAKPAGYEHSDRFGEQGALILSVRLDEGVAVPGYGIRGMSSLPAEIDPCVLMRGIGAADTPPPPLWLDAACAALAQSRPVSAVAAQIGMHPVAFARSFRRHLGTSPAAWRQARRLARALPPLLLGRAPLAEIAAEAGFADQAHFGHALRKTTGFTAGQLRKLLAA